MFLVRTENSCQQHQKHFDYLLCKINELSKLPKYSTVENIRSLCSTKLCVLKDSNTVLYLKGFHRILLSNIIFYFSLYIIGIALRN
jgi:hypothetical protein